MKVNKEEMLGMLVALDLYVKKDHEQERREFDKRAEAIQKSAAEVPGVKAEIFVPEVANHVPHVRISWDAAAKGMTAAEVVKRPPRRRALDRHSLRRARRRRRRLDDASGRREDRRPASSRGARRRRT